MQQHVHLGDRSHRTVDLLLVEIGLATVLALLVDVFLRDNQHAARAPTGVVDLVLQLRLDQANHHPHHRAGRVELAPFLVYGVGEIANEVLLGGAQQIRNSKSSLRRR